MIASRIYLLLGSNLGDRLRLLQAAVHYLTLHLARGQVTCSSVYETAAWGKEDQPAFLNMAVGMDTTLTPELVLAATRQIEQSFGRQRIERWGERTLDIDILFYGQEVINSPQLTIPHPQIQARRFALVPMSEIASDLVHPILRKTILQLLQECTDSLEVKVFEGGDL